MIVGAVALLLMGSGLAVAAGTGDTAGESSPSAIVSDRPAEPVAVVVTPEPAETPPSSDLEASRPRTPKSTVAGSSAAPKSSKSRKPSAKSADREHLEDDERETVRPPVRDEDDDRHETDPGGDDEREENDEHDSD